MYYIGRPKGVLKYEYPGKFTRDVSSIASHGVIFGSSVNIDDPDLDRYPLYAKATPYRVVLEEGDILYLPAYWHHEVQSLPDEEGLNIAVNFWYENMTAPVDDVALLKLKH